MKFSIATALTVLAGVASARIDYFTVPSTIKPGDKFEVTLEGHNYIQSMYEIAAAFGITGSVYSQYSDSLQIYLDSVYLGPEKSNTVHNYKFPVTLPESVQKGDYTFGVGLFELVGALNSPSAGFMHANITVGDETSSELVEGGF
ncbi:hypothetical protein AAP_01282 [Ascosphaera apis ARSEF 7405]|uniref:Secreted protein NIS1 n=1 Tax=Ascosphaera apis ARSEF 7405 TaxID=392613 RepID=A0A168BQK6_9EURO|nr:hypothetical protein AAP_01282 [Ascosphaera apis ARSEF 7405]